MLTIIKGEVSTLAGIPEKYGLIDGDKQNALFYFPSGICFSDHHQALFVSDSGNCRIRKVQLNGIFFLYYYYYYYFGVFIYFNRYG